MHSLARRACIDNAWCFEFPRKIRRKLIVLTETAQHQNLRVELVLVQLRNLRIGVSLQLVLFTTITLYLETLNSASGYGKSASRET